MIQSITLKNWKSFGDATLYVDPLTVLIGANASGKSNLLDALVFLGELGKGRNISEALAGTGNGYKGIRGGKNSIISTGAEETIIGIEFGEQDSLTFTYLITIRADENFGHLIGEESLSYRQKEKLVPLFTLRNQEYLFTEMNIALWAAEALDHAFQQNAVMLAKRILRSDLGHLQVIDPIPQNMRDYSPLSASLQADGNNLAGYLAQHSHQTEIEAQLTTLLKDLPENEITKIWSEPVGRLAKDAMLYCEERWPGRSEPLLTDATGISDGTLRLVAILTALLAAEPGSTLAVEEIDNGLHPSRAKLLVKLLREIGVERGVDVICTTHNPALLDAFGLEMLPYIFMVYRDAENGTSRLRALDEIEHFERIITKGTLGDLITKGRFDAALKAS